MDPLPALPLSIIQINQNFQGLTCALGSAMYAHPARTGGKICSGFRPSSSIVCFPCVSSPLFLHKNVGNQRDYRTSYTKFFMMVSFIWRWLSFDTFWSLWICNNVSVFLFRFIRVYLFLYIVVLFLFGCHHFLRYHEVWVQFISVRWLL